MGKEVVRFSVMIPRVRMIRLDVLVGGVIRSTNSRDKTCPKILLPHMTAFRNVEMHSCYGKRLIRGTGAGRQGGRFLGRRTDLGDKQGDLLPEDLMGDAF